MLDRVLCDMINENDTGFEETAIEFCGECSIWFKGKAIHTAPGECFRMCSVMNEYAESEDCACEKAVPVGG